MRIHSHSARRINNCPRFWERVAFESSKKKEKKKEKKENKRKNSRNPRFDFPDAHTRA